MAENLDRSDNTNLHARPLDPKSQVFKYIIPVFSTSLTASTTMFLEVDDFIKI